jgi:hypothetical protein
VPQYVPDAMGAAYLRAGVFRDKALLLCLVGVAVLEDHSPVLYLANSTENSYGERANSWLFQL